MSNTDRTPQTMDDLSGFQRDLLFAIAGEDRPSGQDVKEVIDTYYSSEINHGRLYPNLDTLVDMGLVEKGQLDRRTNYYQLTARGERAIAARREWESQLVAGVSVQYPTIFQIQFER